MSELKPMPVSKEKFLSLIEAFLEWSMAWGIKVKITMGPTEAEESKEEGK